MDYIFTDGDYVSSSDHWFYEIKSKFVIINPKNLWLEHLSAKYQLCKVEYDPFAYHSAGRVGNASDISITNCFFGTNKEIPRSCIIGEPTPQAFLQWIRLYGHKSEYRNIMLRRVTEKPFSFRYGDQLETLKKQYKSLDEFINKGDKGLYEFAFVWDYQGEGYPKFAENKRNSCNHKEDVLL